MLAAWLAARYRQVWWTLVVLLALPAGELLARYLGNALGANPLEALLRGTGRWALILLLASLAVTPLRRLLVYASRKYHARWGKRLSDWNWIVRLRRMIGLYSFSYAALHAVIFVHFDLGWDLRTGLAEVGEKPYLLAGAAALMLLIPLAATSTDGAIRRMGRAWRRLHRLSYAVAVIVLAHYWWLTKPGAYDPLLYTILAALLLGYRLAARRGVLAAQPGDGMEVPERGAALPRGKPPQGEKAASEHTGAHARA